MNQLQDGTQVTVEFGEETTVTHLMSISGHKFDADDVYEVLYGLKDADGIFVAILIDDYELAQTLENIGVAFRCTRGGYRRDKNYESFCNMIGFDL